MAGLGEDDARGTQAHLAPERATQERMPLVTTEKELRAWYVYDWANSVVSSVSIVLLMPLIIEQLAFEHGTLEGTQGTPCNQWTSDTKPPACLVPFIGSLTTDTVSYTFYVTAISVLCQAIVFISIGSLADHGNSRKTLLIGFTAAGSLFNVLIMTAYRPDLYAWAATLMVLINICFGSAIVFYNAFLPLLVDSHPDVLRAINASPNGPAAREDEAVIQLAEDLANTISTKGYIAGYASGILLLVVALGVVVLGGQTLWSLGLGVALSGVWWMGWSLYTFAYLRPRPGPPLPPNGGHFILFSWRKVIRTFMACGQLKNTFIFLLAFLMYMDAVSTISYTAILFGRRLLDMTDMELIIIAIVVPLTALMGNYGFYYLQRNLLHYHSKRMVILLVLLSSLIPLYGIIGLFNTTVGLYNKPELYGVGAYYGLVLGAIQSYSRTLFAELIPPGHESEFFSIYEITDKGSSWFGPLVIAVIIDATDEPRYAFVFLLALLLVPVPLLMRVDVVAGRRDALAYRQKEQTPEDIPLEDRV